MSCKCAVRVFCTVISQMCRRFLKAQTRFFHFTLFLLAAFGFCLFLLSMFLLLQICVTDVAFSGCGITNALSYSCICMCNYYRKKLSQALLKTLKTNALPLSIYKSANETMHALGLVLQVFSILNTEFFCIKKIFTFISQGYLFIYLL